MSQKKLVSYRLPVSLIQMIKDTSIIMDRTEADTVRIILFRACRFWITKKENPDPDGYGVNLMDKKLSQLELEKIKWEIEVNEKL